MPVKDDTKIRFDQNTVIIASYYADHSDTQRHRVHGRAQANRLTRELIMKGYSVAWSTALIEAMRHGSVNGHAGGS